jgi:CDP-paratose 2-epimerase
MKKIILITGGAGFIGTNTADKLLSSGYSVILLDDLSRRGSRANLLWLKSKWKNKFDFIKTSVTEYNAVLKKSVDSVDAVIHLAAQVAVTTSVIDPREDFNINALGSFNLLEAVRTSKSKPFLIYSSTNKVYGNITDQKIKRTKNGYEYASLPQGIDEKTQLNFETPYGCSKGTADQYARDYARMYNLKTVVFRQSCIYGPHQFGIEDQGWVAWFIIAALLKKKITIYGDGWQTRDLLYVEDLCDLYINAVEKQKNVSGKIYNIGGGHDNVLSVLGLIHMLESIMGEKIKYDFADWRPGDQKSYVSNIAEIKKDLKWHPSIKVAEGVYKTYEWIKDNLSVINNNLK